MDLSNALARLRTDHRDIKNALLKRIVKLELVQKELLMRVTLSPNLTTYQLGIKAQQCKGQTLKKHQCKRKSRSTKGLCFQHST